MAASLFRSAWFRRMTLALGITLALGLLYFDAFQAILPALVNVFNAQAQLALLPGPEYWQALEALGVNRSFWQGIVSLTYGAFAFGVTVLGGLVIISQFVLPEQTMRERQLVFDHFLRYAAEHFTGRPHGPIIFVRDGKLVARGGEEKQQGYGVAVVDAVSAIVIERAASPFAPLVAATARPAIAMFRSGAQEPARRAPSGPPLVRAAGPGVTFISPGERIVATLDLRRQSRRQTVQALTRDGIEVEASVSVTFGLDPGHEPSAAEPIPSADEPVVRNRPAYTFNPLSAFRAVYGTALGEKQPVAWTELPLAVAVERFRDLLAEHTLDELLQPTVPGAYPFGDFQASLGQAVKDAPVLRERGIVVYHVGLGRFTLPREVDNEHVRHWRVGWKKAIYQRIIAAETVIMSRLGRRRAEAQEEIIKVLRERLTADPGQSRAALALMLNKALQEAARDPTTRKLLPDEILRTLDNMQEWLP
jgi:hypothetical protein